MLLWSGKTKTGTLWLIRNSILTSIQHNSVQQYIYIWEFYTNKYTDGKYNMILGRDLLMALVLGLIFSERIIAGGDRPY